MHFILSIPCHRANNHAIRRICQTIVTTGLLIFLSAFAVGNDDIHQQWAEHDPSQTFTPNHEPMSQILGFITDASKAQDKYSYFRLQGAALKYLNDYKGYLERIPVSQLNKNEQLAYWLNLHNLLVIEKFANNLKKAKRINKKRGTPQKAGKWWHEKVTNVEGAALSINDIEQNVLVRHWDNPLFLYGLFYGVKGHGFSGTQGFTGASVMSHLEGLAKKFIENDSNIEIDGNEVAISSLLGWNKESVFNDDEQKLLGHIQAYATGNKALQLASVNVIQDKYDFDWKSLAQRPPRQSTANASNVNNSSAPVYRGGS